MAGTIDNTRPFGSMLKDKSGPPKKRQNSGKRDGQEFQCDVHRKQIKTLRCCIPECTEIGTQRRASPQSLGRARHGPKGNR